MRPLLPRTLAHAGASAERRRHQRQQPFRLPRQLGILGQGGEMVLPQVEIAARQGIEIGRRFGHGFDYSPGPGRPPCLLQCGRIETTGARRPASCYAA
jgi:hypothetical protein